jgi:hypothetical protein
MNKKTVYPCPECNSMDVQPIKNNPKYDNGNIFGFTPTDYRKLPTWKCNNCNSRWNNYKTKMHINPKG